MPKTSVKTSNKTLTKKQTKLIFNVLIWVCALPYAVITTTKLSRMTKTLLVTLWFIIIICIVSFGIIWVHSTIIANNNTQGELAGVSDITEITSTTQIPTDTTTTLTFEQKQELVQAIIRSNKKVLLRVESVVDGDTIKVEKLGTLRLIGMDTPETKDPRKPVQCFGTEASNRAKTLLSNQKVYLTFDPANQTDKYDRILAYVYREDGYFYNREMIADGYAHSYKQYPHPKLDDFNAAEVQARENQQGLWSPTTCNGDTTQPAK